MTSVLRSKAPRPAPEHEILTKPVNCASKQGTLGTKILCKSNYFKLTNKTDWCLYMYRVDFSPCDDRTRTKKALIRTHKDKLGAYIFDGTVLYTSHRLPQPLELTSESPYSDIVPAQVVQIKIRLVGDLPIGDYHYLQFFNIVVRRCLEHLKLQLVGRDYYDPSCAIDVREYKLQLWPGYITSIRQHERDVMMCVETSFKVMRQQTLYDLLTECREKNPRDFKNMYADQVLGSVVLTDYNNKTYKIDDIDWENNPKHTFTSKDDEKIIYADYYRNKYSIKLRDMGQPLLVSRSTARDRRAGQSELIYLIPELCRSTGLTDTMRKDFKTMRALAEHTRLVPQTRIERLLQFNRRLSTNKDISNEFDEWNFKFEDHLTDVPARIIETEKIHFHGRAITPKVSGDWNFDAQENKMFAVSKLNSWHVIVPSKHVDDAKTFIQSIMSSAAAMNFKIDRPKIVRTAGDRTDEYVHGLRHTLDKETPQLILCIVPNVNGDRYAAIKKELCITAACPSQVLQAKTLRQKSQGMMKSVSSKVAVQLNCKIGGHPWTVELSHKVPNMMVIGFDVCHDKASTDYGAMVASLDPLHYGSYYSAVTQHSNGEELSNNIAVHISHALHEYRRKNNCLPERILVYRDGVGEGQLRYVADHEVSHIYKRLAGLYGGEEKVKLTFIIVTKRINTRIFHNGRNPQPGTIVDDVITSPLKFDFFLVSQNVRQGTVSPTAYNIIHNSGNLSANALQKITYKFCHMYFNFSGTVRVPAPCQYAHKLAFFTSQALRTPAHQALRNTLYFL
ncbi:piwi-like protein Siwi [Trichogramma pretiosum]|uniref:Piwi domain-containing protein n=1 Tax=Trichogramma kaykai TaxID=54128 RepID=A0ABD2W1A4_9HYME|nr:piwi-like protein Siwi [Trichogramma pretiosum]XP_014229709.1 piwi-like protein Siwi [Trichogramma pretiosum]